MGGTDGSRFSNASIAPNIFKYCSLFSLNISEFNNTVTGSYGGCWVSIPDNSGWTTGLSDTNGWANMFTAYSGSGVPRNAAPTVLSNVIRYAFAAV